MQKSAMAKWQVLVPVMKVGEGVGVAVADIMNWYIGVIIEV